MDNQFDQIYDCVTIESIESYLQLLSCMNILCSLRERGRLKRDFDIGISILCFKGLPQQISLRPCTVT